MDLSAQLLASLAALTHALDDPEADLESQVTALTADLQVAVSSYLGLRMTIAFQGYEVSFTVPGDASPTAPDIATSLLIPLADVIATDTGSTLVLYAGMPGAFVDLAADLGYALGVDHRALILDNHLVADTGSSGMIGLQEHFAINQAVGVLIDVGYTSESALAELQRLANLDHLDLYLTAAQIVRGTNRSVPDGT